MRLRRKRLRHHIGDVSARRAVDELDASTFNDIQYGEKAQLNMLCSPAVASVSRYRNARLVVAINRPLFFGTFRLLEELVDTLVFLEGLH